MTLGYYFSRLTIIASSVTVLGVNIFILIHDRDYKSEWLTSESMIPFMIIFELGYCLILSCLCMSIFLTEYKKVRENRISTALCWFVLPMSFIAYAFTYSLDGIGKSVSGFIYLAIQHGPFAVGLLWTYFHYISQKNTDLNG